MSGPVLALDYGSVRTGLACSDPGRVLATGLPTFVGGVGKSLRRHVESIVKDREVTGIVVGIPVNESVEPTPFVKEILLLAQWFDEKLGLSVALWDETMTSREAEERLKAAPKKVRSDKGAIDRLAAETLLQEFLDAGCPFARDGLEQWRARLTPTSGPRD